MNVTEADLRFAELVARTGLEARIGGGVGTELDAIPAEFGTVGRNGLLVESLTTADVVEAKWCVCDGDLTRVGA